MQTFDQHLLQHLHAGRVTMEDAMRIATSPHDFKLMVAAASKPKDDGPEAEIRASVPMAPSAPPAPAPVASEHVAAPPAPPMTVGLSEPDSAAPPAPSAPPPGVTY